MKSQLSKCFVLVAALAGSAAGNNVFAQDAALSEYEIIDAERERFERDKILYSPGEGEVRYVPRVTIDPPKNTTEPKTTSSTTPTSSRQDSVSVKTVVPAMNPAPTRIKQEAGPKPLNKPLPPKENDDAILSFNFLYYIIQKYKLQDIVE